MEHPCGGRQLAYGDYIVSLMTFANVRKGSRLVKGFCLLPLTTSYEDSPLANMGEIGLVGTSYAQK